MEEPSGHAAATSASFELGEDASAVGHVVDIRQQVEDLTYALHLTNYLGQR